MTVYNTARKINGKIKAYKRKRAGEHLSAVRRIERVAPLNKRVCAMTFDDGPSAMLATNKSEGLTKILCDILKEYNSYASFDIIGTTENNYPDKEGRAGDFTWSGVHFDHYPKFNEDKKAGAVNQKELVKMLLDAGNEITNHSYTHRLFGKMRAIYGKRICQDSLSDVVNDLNMLHKFMEDNFNYKMTLSRPPHYIDRIKGGASSYDAYRIMGYNYMAASFDGRGWQGLNDYNDEVSDMIRPMEKALVEDENSLNGQIIFQKDGCNMNLRTPIADALEPQLKLLKNAGYEIVSVSELLRRMPFEDVKEDDEFLPYVKNLLEKKHTIGYQNNTFQPDRYISDDEFYIMCTEPDLFKVKEHLSYNAMVKTARDYAADNGLILKGGISGESVYRLSEEKEINLETPIKTIKNLKRRDVMEVVSKLSK